MKSIFGYFDAPYQTEPAHDPGMDVPCPVCWAAPVGGQPVTTISVMGVGGSRSYFFRAHKACWEEASEDTKSDIEAMVVDP